MEESRFTDRQWWLTLESKQLAPSIKEGKCFRMYTAELGMYLTIRNLRPTGHYYIKWYEETLKYGPHNFAEKDRTLREEKFTSLEEALKFFDDLHYKKGTYRTE